jgi:predicted alpha/beta-hydrolase family hydrolase
MSIPLLREGDGQVLGTIVLAHGAGAPMDSPFMNERSAGLAARGAAVVRFEFPYMHARRVDNKRGGPDRQPELLATYRAVIAQLGDPRSLVIGGKSMGGRMASLIADELQVRGLVCLGYPFHPAGKPKQLRVAHLETLTTPTLIVQGTRDTLGDRSEVGSYTLSSRIQLAWSEDGDHSFAPRKKSGRTTAQAMQEAIDHVAAFMASRPRTS